MIVDLDHLAAETSDAYDVCIVGTGPAGTTLTRELAGSGLRVVVLESGGERTTRHADALRRVGSEGIQIKEYSRERVLGGASTTWAGLSSPLDGVELEPRETLGIPGWPIAREELEEGYRGAAARYRFAPPEMYAERGFGVVEALGDRQPRWRDVEPKTFLACSDPQDFGAEHRAVYERDDVTLVLDATVLRLGSDGARVTHAVVRTSGGAEREVFARAFVLATGGIENARLLLLSRDSCERGLGNEHDQVGRCLMNHPKRYRGVIRLAEPVRELPYYFGCLYRGYAGYAGLRLRDEVQRDRGLLNAYVRFEPLFPWSDDRGVESLVLLAKRSRGLLGAWKARRQGKLVTLRDYSETGDDSDLQNQRKSWLGWLGVVATVLLHLPMVVRYAVARLRDGRSPLVTRVRLRNFMEMEPHPDNRVTLGDERDAYGQPIPVVRHHPTELDKLSLIALHETLADELERNGLGVLESDLATAEPWPIDMDASHHMGTTRMGTDARVSVVDPDLRVHATENLWVAGASVFPTSGCANPTLTIVALSIRLARHLRGELGADAAGASASGAATDAATDESGRPRASSSVDDGRRRVLVVGAGTRVRDDVLPVFETLADRYELRGVVAKHAKTIDVGGRPVEVRALDDLTADDVTSCDLAYVAVSKGSVPRVLARLLHLGGASLDLLVDTPVLLFKHLGEHKTLERFRRVWVPEDCATLPWIELVQRACEESGGALGPLREVVFDRSAYRYHALALARTLFGGAAIRRVRRRRTRDGARWEIALEGGGRATLIEPRDYAGGSTTFVGERGRAGDAADAPLRLVPTVEDGRCRGFRLGALQAPLEPVESELAGPFAVDDTVTSRMAELKRVGLRRLLVDVSEGRGAYPLGDALDDMLIDALVERAGFHVATPFTSGRSRLARAGLGAALKVFTRG